MTRSVVPIYPQRGEDESAIDESEDVLAIRRHLDFLSSETAAQKGLQGLLIEHAFFGDDQRYVAATRKRWHRLSEFRLTGQGEVTPCNRGELGTYVEAVSPYAEVA